MKATVDQAALNAAIKTVLPAVPRHGSGLHVLNGIRLHATDNGRIEATCTNLDLTIHTAVDATVAEPGVAVVPAPILARIVATLDGPIDLAVDDRELTVDAAATNTRLRVLPADEWPTVAAVAGDPVVLEGPALADLRRILHAASTDNTRPALCGIHFGPGYAEATDSYRLAHCALPEVDQPDVNVPQPALRIALAGQPDSLEVRTSERLATFTAPGLRTSWTTRLIEEEFPPTRRFLERTSKHELTVDCADLSAAVNRAVALGEADGARIVLRYSDGRLDVTATRFDVGNVSATVDADGDFTDRLAFNPGKFLDLLAAAGDGSVTFQIVDHMKPVIVDAGNVALLLMPVRL